MTFGPKGFPEYWGPGRGELVVFGGHPAKGLTAAHGHFVRGGVWGHMFQLHVILRLIRVLPGHGERI